MKLHNYYIYILTNANHTVLYTGVTNDLSRRCFEHKQKKIKGFTQKYNVDKLLYFERFDFIDLAIVREKQIKGYSRAKKVALINVFNPEWKELYNNGRIEIPVQKNIKEKIPHFVRNDSTDEVLRGARGEPHNGFLK